MYLAQGTLIAFLTTVLFKISNEAFIGSSLRAAEKSETFSVAKENSSIHYSCCPNDTPFCKGKCVNHQCEGSCESNVAVEAKLKNNETLPNFNLKSTRNQRIGCPLIEEIPDKYGDVYICAVRYDGPGGFFPPSSCNGNAYGILDGAGSDAGFGSLYLFGSFQIKAGCTLYLYRGSYAGDTHFTTGPFTWVLNQLWWWQDSLTAVWGPRSYYCTCQQKPLTCTPYDVLEEIANCDNTKNRVGNGLCSYYYVYGTAYSADHMMIMSISPSLPEEVAKELAARFSRVVGVSSSTGYDWTAPSVITRTFALTSGFASIQIRKGKSMKVYQVVGYCGDTIIKTDKIVIR